jgi:hypothetical protein
MGGGRGVVFDEAPSRISEPKKDDSESYIMRSFINFTPLNIIRVLKWVKKRWKGECMAKLLIGCIQSLVETRKERDHFEAPEVR